MSLLSMYPEISIGDRFRRLTVKSDIYIKDGRPWCSCECACGTTLETRISYLLSGATKSCGCLRNARAYRLHPYTGHGEVSGKYLSGLKRGAKIRELEFNITSREMWRKFQEQNGKCALSGVDLILNAEEHQIGGCGNTASLDRIDSQKGYVSGNIQWVHKHVNKMKGDLPDSEFIKWCQTISNNWTHLDCVGSEQCKVCIETISIPPVK